MRRNSILSVFSIRSIYTIFSVCTVISILAINTVFSVCTLRFYLISLFIGQPVSIKRPIIDAVRIFLYTDSRCYAIFPINSILTINTIFSVFTICTVINRNRIVFCKSYRIANDFTVIGYRGNTCYIIIIL